MKRSLLYLGLFLSAGLIFFAFSSPQFKKRKLYVDFSWTSAPRYPFIYNKLQFFGKSPQEQAAFMQQTLALEEVNFDKSYILLDEQILSNFIQQLLYSNLLNGDFSGYYNSPQNKGALKGRYYKNIYQSPYPLEHDGRMLFTEISYHLDHSPQRLKAMFRQNKDLIFRLVPHAVYEDSPLKLYTETLLKTHDYIFKHPDYRSIFEEIQETIDRMPRGNSFCDPLLCPDFMEPLIHPEVRQDFMHDCQDDDASFTVYCNYRDVMWFHSFWFRRHLEHNIEEVYEILQAIQAHYATTK